MKATGLAVRQQHVQIDKLLENANWIYSIRKFTPVLKKLAFEIREKRRVLTREKKMIEINKHRGKLISSFVFIKHYKEINCKILTLKNSSIILIR